MIDSWDWLVIGQGVNPQDFDAMTQLPNTLALNDYRWRQTKTGVSFIGGNSLPSSANRINKIILLIPQKSKGFSPTASEK